MATTTLQVPKTGRSRFSKALPAPPPGLDDSETMLTGQAPRELFSVPVTATAFPPRGSSRKPDTVAVPVLTKPVDSPLPALPTPPSETTTPKPVNTIPRKAVGSSTTPKLAPTPVKLKRNSSISSLLSAYSHSTAETPQRSSNGSTATKDSEDSLSPERGRLNDEQKEIVNSLHASTGLSFTDMMDELMLTAPKPPTSVKSELRPSTPRVGLPTSPRPEKTLQTAKQDADVPVSIAAASPPRREIRRRRASSKSDPKLVVTDLKLPLSNGSTAAATVQAQQAGQSLSISQTIPPTVNESPLPLSTSATPPQLVSLPGNTIKQQPDNDDADMKKLIAKLETVKAKASERASSTEPKIDESDKPSKQVDEQAKNRREDVPPAVPAKDASLERPSSDTIKPAVKSAVPSISPVSSLETLKAPQSVQRRLVASEGQQQARTQSNVESQTSQASTPSSSHKQAPSSSSIASVSRFPPRASSKQRGLPSGPRSGRSASEASQTSYPAGPAPMIRTELYDLVAAQEPSDVGVASQTSGDNVKRRTPLTGIDENSTEPARSESRTDEKRSSAVEQALNRFPRQRLRANTDSIVEPRTPTMAHYNCLSNHRDWLRVKNENHPIGCMACKTTEKSWRAVCKTCCIRVCYDCAEKLSKKDLKTLRAEMNYGR